MPATVAEGSGRLGRFWPVLPRLPFCESRKLPRTPPVSVEDVYSSRPLALVAPVSLRKFWVTTEIAELVSLATA